jgi:hypothetical protein
MGKLIVAGVVAAGIALGTACQATDTDDTEPEQAAFSPYVDEMGNITVPRNYRTEWAFLGTWSVASDSGQPPGAKGLHTVYTQPGTIEAYRETGAFPDGAVLVKELLSTQTGSMTTGQVSRGEAIEGWFVMIKDTEGRFADNPLWGDGWGWALFNAEDPTQTVTENYKAECIQCHVPARQTDWTYVEGYPPLRGEAF